MQNKPNFMDIQMSVSSVMTKHYKQKAHLAVPAEQSQTNPIKPNFKRENPLIIGFISVFEAKPDLLKCKGRRVEL